MSWTHCALLLLSFSIAAVVPTLLHQLAALPCNLQVDRGQPHNCCTPWARPCCLTDFVDLRAADDAVAKLSKETGHSERLAALAIDISNAKSVEAAAAALERDFAGKLGGVINNAAVSSRFPSATVD